MKNRVREWRNAMSEEGKYFRNMRHRIQMRRIALKEDQPIRYHAGEINVICQYCGLLRFARKPLNCCQNGKVLLPNLQDYPAQRLFDSNDHEGTSLGRKFETTTLHFHSLGLE